MRDFIVVFAALAVAAAYPKTDDAKDQGHVNLNQEAPMKTAPTILASLAKPTDEKTPLNPIQEEKSEEIARHKKSATTTFCVEIKPTDPYHKPYQLCETGNQQYYIQAEDYKPAAPAYGPPAPAPPKSYGLPSSGYSKPAPSHPSPSYSGPKPSPSYNAPSPGYSSPKSFNAASSSGSNGPYPAASSNAAESKPGYPNSYASPNYAGGSGHSSAAYRSGEESDEAEHVGDEAMEEDEEEEMEPSMRSAGYGGYSGYGGGFGGDYGYGDDDGGTMIKFKGMKTKKGKGKKGYGGHGLVITCQPNLAGYAGMGGAGGYGGGYAAGYRNSYPGASRSYPKYKSKYGGQQSGYGSRGMGGSHAHEIAPIYFAGHGYANNAESSDEGESNGGSNGASASAGYGSYGGQGFGSGSSGAGGNSAGAGGMYGGGAPGYGGGSSGGSGAGGVYGGGAPGYGGGSSGGSGAGGAYGGGAPGYGGGSSAGNGGGGGAAVQTYGAAAGSYGAPPIYNQGYYVQPQPPIAPPSPPAGAYGGASFSHQIFAAPGPAPATYPAQPSYPVPVLPYGSAASSSGASFGAPGAHNPVMYGSPPPSASYTPPGTYRSSEDAPPKSQDGKPSQKDADGTVSMTSLEDKEKHTLNVMSGMAQSRASGTKWENDMRASTNSNEGKPQEAKEDHMTGKWKSVKMAEMEAENMKKQ